MEVRTFVACVASVSGGSGAKDCSAKNGASKRRGRGKEGRKSLQTNPYKLLVLRRGVKV